MKRGYHSRQSKIYGNIPRSEFYGFVLGYAVGTILRGIFNLQSNTFSLILAAAGLGIGIWVDRKYYSVQDAPEMENDEALLEEAAPDKNVQQTAHGSRQQAAIPADDGVHPEGTQEGSMQQRLKQMFGKYEDGKID